MTSDKNFIFFYEWIYLQTKEKSKIAAILDAAHDMFVKEYELH